MAALEKQCDGSVRDSIRPTAANVEDEDRARVAAAQAAPDIGTWLWDVVADEVRGDRNLNSIFGLVADSGPRPLSDYLRAIHPDDVASVWSAIGQAIADNGAHSYEAEYRLVSGGRQRWVRAQGIVRRNAMGVAVDLSGVVRDISQQKFLDERRRELLRETQLQSRVFDAVLSAIAEHAYLFDLEGRFSYVNAAVLKRLSLSAAQVLGRGFVEVGYDEELAARLQSAVQRVIDERNLIVVEGSYPTTAGDERIYEHRFVPVFAADGSLQVIAGVAQDVTTRKRAEAMLL